MGRKDLNYDKESHMELQRIIEKYKLYDNDQAVVKNFKAYLLEIEKFIDKQIEKIAMGNGDGKR